jgi:hypothetical protein
MGRQRLKSSAMPNRKYNARVLDMQFARYNEGFSPTGDFSKVSKAQIENSLKNAVDPATFNAVFSKLPDLFVPMALRWRCSPDIGLPISPFSLYKRPKAKPYPLVSVQSTPGAPGQYLVPEAYWQLNFLLMNTGPAGAVTIAAVDENGDLYPDSKQTFTLAANALVPVKLHFPNMFGIMVLTGTAALQSLTGTRMGDFLNDGDWEPAETAGLPFKAAGPHPMVYQNLQQGYPGAPVTGYQAAINRVAVAQLFCQTPAYAQPDGTILPAWPLPPAGALVDSYHNVQQTAGGTSTGVLYDIQEMLTRVYNDPNLYDGRQTVFMKEVRVAGFTDDGTQSSAGGTMRNPICSTTLMAAATDCWSALGLGFGTTDFANPGADATPDCDYMVSAMFRVPAYTYSLSNGGIVRKFDHYYYMEMAAAAHMAQPLGPVSGLGCEMHAENRPLKTDGRFSDDVKLYWNAASRNVPQSYAVALKDPLTGIPRYLNAARPFLAGMMKPHLPTARADAGAEDIAGPDAANVNRFFHHRSERSDTAAVTKQYYVAANDVFGRWSAFSKTALTLQAAPQATADIISGQFVLDPPSDMLVHTYKGTLELTVAWHWDDRRPFEINIGGRFQPLPTLPAMVKKGLLQTPSGIALDVPGASVIDISIAFNGPAPYVKKLAPQPGIATAAEATVTIDEGQSRLPHLGVYKIRIKNFVLAFTPGGKLAFAAYLRSRQLVTPSAITPAGKPKVIYAIDPRPRPAPVLPPEVQWGSLPDAQNVSRFHVSFGAVPGVAGYAIYRATEASLRDKGGLPPAAPGDEMNARRDQLMQLAGKPAAKDAFIRLNTQLLDVPEADVELPGDLNGLYVYAVTTFTAQRVESDFGNSWLYVGVPRRYTPPAPVLSAFSKKVEGLKNLREITLNLELPQGVRTDRVELYRTSRSYLASSLDLMGPAASETSVGSPAAGWKAYNAAGLEVKNIGKAGDITMLRKTETVAAGWQPLHYRAAGFGANEKAAGKLPGRSASSNLAEVLTAPPDSVPTLVNATLMPAGNGLLRLEALTDGEIRTTPYGSFRMRLEKLNLATNVYSELWTRELPLIPPKSPKAAAADGTLWRLGKDAAGNYEYEYYVTAEDIASYRITITDPLGRSTGVTVRYSQPAAAFRNILLKPMLLSTELSFELNISNKLPAPGHYTLDIIVQKKTAGSPVPVSTNVYSGSLDAIGNVNVPAANPCVFVTSKSADGFYLYEAVFKGSAYGAMFSGASVLLRLTDPNGKVTTYNSLARQQAK